MRAKWILVAVITMICCSPILLGADSAPKMMNYQGLLLDTNGDPVTTCVSMTFTIYDAASGGTVVWQETHSSVCPDEGHFDVLLGGGDAKTDLGDDVFASADRWLGVAVGTDAELTPRTRLVTGAYSHRVSTIDGAAAGALEGPMEIIPDEAKRADGSLVIRALGSCDAVTINPSADIALQALNGSCEEVLFLGAADAGGVLQVNATDAVKALTRMVEIDPAMGLALRTTEENGDETVAIMSQASGGTFHVSATDVAKTLARTVEIAPANNYVLRATEQNGDQTMAITSSAEGAAMTVASTDAVKATTRTVEIAPAQNVAMRVTEDNDDEVFSITTDENGATVQVSASDAAKALTGSVLIQPYNNIALQAKDGSGNTQLEAITDPVDTRVTFYEIAKDGKAATKKLELSKNALKFFDATGTDEMFRVDGDGNVFSRGNFIGGQPSVKDTRAGAWATAFGFTNTAEGDSSACLGGFNNKTYAWRSTIAGGAHNQTGTRGKSRATGGEAIGGGSSNLATGLGAVVAGGQANAATADHASVAGGLADTASAQYAVVSGGANNKASEWAAVIGGGYQNKALSSQSTVGGGTINTAEGQYSTVSGGGTNTTNGLATTIAGGGFNEATADYATVSGGTYGNARGQYSVVGGGGGSTEADSNTAKGAYSVVPGGRGNLADGNYSLAAGRRAQATNHGALVWADSEDADFASERDDQVRFRADGGLRVDDDTSWFDIRDDGTYLIQTSTGANLTLAGVWANTSDRNSKENFEQIDKQALLDKLAQLEITEWNYKVEDDGTRHIGPMAQDFYRIFGIGTDDKTISSLDPAGVALAAIQALHEKTQEIDDLKDQMAKLQALVNKLLSERQ